VDPRGFLSFQNQKKKENQKKKQILRPSGLRMTALAGERVVLCLGVIV
jgi:hypothetical protein